MALGPLGLRAFLVYIMRIEDIVDALNISIRETRANNKIKAKSFLVLKKNVIPNETFKAYKDFEYNIYVVNGKDIHHIIKFKRTDRTASDEQVEAIKSICEKELCTKLFSWANSPYYDQVVNDNYEGVEE